MSDLKIICTCGKEFSPTSKMLIEHKESGGLIELYYLCPYCKNRHHVCYINAEVKHLQKLIDKARAQDNTQNRWLKMQRKWQILSQNLTSKSELPSECMWIKENGL